MMNKYERFGDIRKVLVSKSLFIPNDFHDTIN